MNCSIEKKDIYEITSTNILQQTSFWAKVKNQQGLQPNAFNFKASYDLLSPNSNPSKSLNDDLLVLLRQIDDCHCFAYVPYGPKVEPEYENYGVFLEEFSESLRPLLPSNCILVRYDLPWENQWSTDEDYFDHNGQWEGPPPVKNQEFRMNFKTFNWNLHRSPSDILPTNTFFLNLNQPEEKLLQQMKPKTRYNIRLSFRKGVSVRECGFNELDKWYDLYVSTSLRNNITLHSKEYFHTVLSQQNESSEQDVKISLLMAEHEGENLAAMFLVLTKNRGTYLYGASSSNNRNLMATYAIQWEAIKIAQNSGCKEYDMFGAAPNAYNTHPLSGLYRFKSGFGGSLYHRMGCWDYPFHDNEYAVFRAQEVNNQKYHNY
jgi:lipid II:glycine glycyltransferase (peptidoglycan interpeptide bridge formation enzyme)